MLIGELAAPGAEIVTVPEYVPCAMPDGFAVIVSVLGVNVADPLVVIHDVLLEAAQVVVAPPAEILTLCEVGAPPGVALKTRLDGLIGSIATGL